MQIVHLTRGGWMKIVYLTRGGWMKILYLTRGGLMKIVHLTRGGWMVFHFSIAQVHVIFCSLVSFIFYPSLI